MASSTGKLSKATLWKAVKGCTELHSFIEAGHLYVVFSQGQPDPRPLPMGLVGRRHHLQGFEAVLAGDGGRRAVADGIDPSQHLFVMGAVPGRGAAANSPACRLPSPDGVEYL